MFLLFDILCKIRCYIQKC